MAEVSANKNSPNNPVSFEFNDIFVIHRIEEIAMLPAETLQDYKKLPSEAQRKVICFIETMKVRYQKKKTEKYGGSIESSFGLLTANNSVSLEEMNKEVGSKS